MFEKFSAQPQSSAVLVADLDKIVTRTAFFYLHGKKRYIRPVAAEKFFMYAEALSGMVALKDRPLADQKKFIVAFYEVVKNVVDPITLKDLERCSLQQLAALYATILDCVTGKTEPVQDEKKK